MPPIDHPHRTRICFVSGTRAEFGLMRTTLGAILGHPSLQLQLIATGMHLDRSRGYSIAEIRKEGRTIDATIPWPSGDGTQTAQAIATGRASAAMAAAFARLQSDIILVVGDRVEALAAASAAHLSGKLVAHVHGGDRALGLVDDALRHAITKLAHIHFPATRQSAERLARLGEDRWRIRLAGSPGLDEIRKIAATWPEVARHIPELVHQLVAQASRLCLPQKDTGETPVLQRYKAPSKQRKIETRIRESTERRFALVLLHPQTPDVAKERKFAGMLAKCLVAVPFERFVIVYPNNDPGSDGITACWDALSDPRFIMKRNLPRSIFLGLLRETALLIGNSSSGIIEAASFGTPVLDIGTRQLGRECGGNVTHVEANAPAIRRELALIWNDGRPIRYPARNIYGIGGAAKKIANTLVTLNPRRFGRKLIAY